jgi:glycosyltransferase involved in cell wall biosynthesis
MTKKMLFVTLDEFSSINSSLEKQLRKHFPGIEFEAIELKSKLKQNPIVLFFGVISVFAEYFSDFVSGRKPLRQWRRGLYHTPFIMRYFNTLIRRHLSTRRYEFIFQTQSVFDTSGHGIPNFVYIDHTNLNNLSYPLINPSEYLSSPRYVRMETMIYKNATLLFVMSENIMDSLNNQYGILASKMKLVYVGSNAQINKVDHRKYSTKNILFVGKDWERKGGPLLITAFKIVQQSIPEATLTIIGCTPSVKINNCRIVGDIPLEEVAEYYNQASVFCLPTKREPFGVAFIEAMLNKLPIVTNTVGATPELIINEKNGYRLDYDATAYAEKLILLLNNPDMCQRFGEYAYGLAKEKYTWDNVGRLISQHIKEVLSEQSHMASKSA